MKISQADPNKKIRVLLVAPEPPPYGGIGNWTIAVLALASGRPDIELKLVNTAPRWRSFDDLSVPKRLVGGTLQGLRDVWRVGAAFLRWKSDVVHLTTSGSLASLRDIVFLWLARCFSVPTVYHIHFGRIPEALAGRTWEWRLMSRAMVLATRIVAIDSSTLEALKSVGFGPTLLALPNGVNVASMPACIATSQYKPNGLVLYLGWVIPTKGVADLVDAWCQISAPGWKLTIAGPVAPAYREELCARAGESAATITFAGELAHVEAMRLLACADVFVLPSYTEGFPNAVLEAMACGRAIVATRVGAIPEMLAEHSDEPCGLLVDPMDAPGLTAAMQRLIDDADLRTVLGAHAWSRVVKEYDMRAVMDKLASLWFSLCGRGTKENNPGGNLDEGNSLEWSAHDGS